MSTEFQALRARCPAKINLMLRVLRRLDDGYHELDTVFQAVGLWDELELRPAESLRLVCDDPAVPADESNLVLRAARALARSAGIERPGGEFRLRKRIPAQAGLGGGSSDAAGALLLAARAWRLGPAGSELADLAADLGADVPYFLVGGTARGRRRGDRISRLAPLEPTPILLGLPPFGIATQVVFREVAERLTLPGNDVTVPRLFGHKWRWEKDFRLAVNDLEHVAFVRWPELERFRDALVETGSIRALLSGSGSTVFGVFETKSLCDAAAKRLAVEFEGWTLTPTQTVTGGVEVSPLV
jgi:4-diphosphocytidyl-2-C-methyl-D-erythritol kinase